MIRYSVDLIAAQNIGTMSVNTYEQYDHVREEHVASVTASITTEIPNRGW
mgnify:CR=1 FL=1